MMAAMALPMAETKRVQAALQVNPTMLAFCVLLCARASCVLRSKHGFVSAVFANASCFSTATHLVYALQHPAEVDPVETDV